MPFVRIDIQSGKSTAYKRALLHGVRGALVLALDVPDGRIMQRLIETPAEDIDAGADRGDSLTIIDISMLPGRGADLKGRLYESIVGNLAADPGIHAKDIMVVVHDPSAECFAVGGVMQCTIAPADVAADDDDEDA
ncbi:MAG: tautomerase family protein [Coriobacteriia bacterium]|nr:tautomerase family protein [Coriobacteriia bacterium]